MSGRPSAVFSRPVDLLVPKDDECIIESPIGKEVDPSVKDLKELEVQVERGRPDFWWSEK